MDRAASSLSSRVARSSQPISPASGDHELGQSSIALGGGMSTVVRSDLRHPDLRSKQRLHDAHERDAGPMANVGEGSRQGADALVLLRIVNGCRADHQRASAYRLGSFQDRGEREARLFSLDAQPAVFNGGVVGAERHHESRVGARPKPW